MGKRCESCGVPLASGAIECNYCGREVVRNSTEDSLYDSTSEMEYVLSKLRSHENQTNIHEISDEQKIDNWANKTVKGCIITILTVLAIIFLIFMLLPSLSAP